jgi:hypothetical protein
MKATLEFQLPEEQEDFDLINKANALYANLFQITEQIRVWRKHGHRFESVDELLDAIWEDCLDHELIQ